jgi:hypothetical protein
MDTLTMDKGIPTNTNPSEGAARRPTARPEQVERIQNITRNPVKKSKRNQSEKNDDFRDFS